MKPKNIEAAETHCLIWDCADIKASLQEVLRYVEQEAQKAINWYWKNKRPKAFASRYIRLLAVFLTSLAAIFPILGQLIGIEWMENALWASLFVGVAGALLALDKAFGFSSGWARYVMAATNIRKTLEEFRMDWTTLSAQACPNPTPEQAEALLQRAKSFRISVESMVSQETKDWVTEFQTNLAQLEKDVAAQLAALKTQAEKAAEAGGPGSIQLTVPNAEKCDDAKFQVKLDSATRTVTDETVTGSKDWVRLNLVPGQYRITVSAKAGGKTVSATAAVIVKPAEIAQPQLSLPI